MQITKGIRRFTRYNLLRIQRLRGTPRDIAGGLAIGVLIGLSPTLPFHTPIIIALTLITRTSLLAGIIVSWLVCNPLTFFPIYYTAVRVGNYLTPYHISIEKIQLLIDSATQAGGFKESIEIVMSLGGEAVVVLLVGGFVFALPFSILSYYLAVPFFEKRQAKRNRADSKILNSS